MDDLGRLAASMRKLLPFVIAADYRPVRLSDRAELRASLVPPAEQLSLFG
jgi:predicted DNA-binding helix-hairpin-helix protein